MVTQAQLLTLHNNFDLLIRDLLNKVCQLVINLQHHLQNITHSSESSDFTPSDNNMLNVNNTNWASILNAYVSVTIITSKLQSFSKYDRSVINDHAWTWMQEMCNYMWFYDKHSAFIDKHVKINHIRGFLTSKVLKLWMIKQHCSDMLNNSIWHGYSNQVDTVDQLFNMIIKTCDELN